MRTFGRSKLFCGFLDMPRVSGFNVNPTFLDLVRDLLHFKEDSLPLKYLRLLMGANPHVGTM